MSVAEAQQAITQGALDAIFNDSANVDRRFPVPVLQCLQIKPLAAGPAGGANAERYRVVLSDIRNYVQCMLATQANHVIHDNQLVRGCLVRIKSYQANSVKGKNILIILDLDVIENLGAHDRIGEPVGFEAKAAAAADTTIGGQGFYGAKPEPSAPVKPEPMSSRMGGGGGGSTNGAQHGGVNIYPIEALSPYAHKWTIKARVSAKSDIKTWHKASGEGKLFSVNLLDESGEIKATGFNEQCDQYYDLLQEGSVYYISNPCRVQLAKKQFSNLPNDYELTFERDTVIEKAEDQSSVPQVRFNFVNVQDLQNIEKDATVDIIGVLKDVGETSEIVSKNTGKPYSKRELTIVDDSQFSVRVTIWGKSATSFSTQPESVVAFKGVKVSDFGGKSLSLLSSGSISVDPDISEAHKLKGWYDSQGRGENFSTHQNSMATLGGATGRQDQTKYISQVKDENLGMDDTSYFSLKATIVYIKQDNFCYPACANESCNKKVVDVGDGTWRCEKCDVSHPRPEYRYIMSINVNDHTNQLWLSCFDDVGRIIMGMTADQAMELKENDENALGAVFEQANCTKLNFRVRAKMDTYGDTQRVRYQVMSATPIDYQAEALKLSDMINTYHRGQAASQPGSPTTVGAVRALSESETATKKSSLSIKATPVPLCLEDLLFSVLRQSSSSPRRGTARDMETMLGRIFISLGLYAMADGLLIRHLPVHRALHAHRHRHEDTDHDPELLDKLDRRPTQVHITTVPSHSPPNPSSLFLPQEYPQPNVAPRADPSTHLTTQLQTRPTGCHTETLTTTVLPASQTTLYAVLAAGLDIAAAGFTTLALNDSVSVVVAAGVLDVGGCLVTAPTIDTVARTETRESVHCDGTTVEGVVVTVTEAPPPPGVTTTEVRPTTVVQHVTQQITQEVTQEITRQVTQQVTVTMQKKGKAEDEEEGAGIGGVHCANGLSPHARC
ncbi:uncharacterized protein JN550_008156 [Neoarthrinium moseri]|uniref:uncharacterized protein n=1 Tax=Neoarthrinium moseri TaxID=1658444 RepID=UPI001FDBF7A9|nr:uncharacterized protein JN550_008156 [Neoarthrinium moseri]KAI1865898.1 hypothetical protein JN550_008156 [Neoarthrinium moseri]